MRDKPTIDPDSTVRHVIISLLIAALPPELHAAAPDLAARVGEHPQVARTSVSDGAKSRKANETSSRGKPV